MICHAGQVRQVARQDPLEPFSAIQMTNLFDADHQMATAIKPREQCVHLVNFQIERLL